MTGFGPAGSGFILAALVLSGGVSAGSAQTDAGPSRSAAEMLEGKIRTIEAAHASGHETGATMRASEVELESYVLYGMRDELGVRLDSLDLSVRPGSFSAAVDMFVDSDLSSFHSIVGPLFEGSHHVLIEGTLAARGGLGTFRLEGVRVDGLIVPVFLVKALLQSLNEPVDLDAPFETPIGIEDVLLLDRSVRVVY